MTLHIIRAIIHSSINPADHGAHEKEIMTMKKIIALALATLMALSLFAGCGASAPAATLFEKFGFTTENVVKAVKSVL